MSDESSPPTSGDERASGRIAACVDVLRERNLRPVVVSLLLFALVENAAWMGILVYAYQTGGAGEMGVVAFAQLVPAVLVAPLASLLGDRFHRVRVLASSLLAVGVACAAVAIAVVAGADPVVVYVASTVVTVIVTLPRPAVGALSPCIVHSSEQLIALNVGRGIAQNVGRMLGPAVAGVLLAVASVDAVFWACAAMMLVAAAMVIRVRLVPTVVEDDEQITFGAIHRETVAGLALLRRERGPRRVVSVLGVTSIVVGALDAATVVVAIDALERNEGLAGVFGTLSGLGGILGAALGVALVGRRRLAPALILAGLIQAVPLIGLALPVSVVSACVIFLVCGIGLSVSEIAGQTLLQGVTPDDVMARVFGALEGLNMAGIALGSLAVSLAFSRFGVDAGALAFVAGIAVLVLLMARGVLAIDRDRPPVDAALLTLVRRVPLFAPLPAYTVEQLLQSFQRLEAAPGDVVMAEGDVGDAMYLVGEGTLDVSAKGRHVQTRGAGEYVGEVALLFDTPRTATIVAATPTVLYRLDRDPFLEAITGHPRSTSRAESQARRRMSTVADDTPDDDTPQGDTTGR